MAAQVPNPDGQYFCEQCCRRYDAAGDCPKCPDEPLLDLLNEDVLLMLAEFDRQRWARRVGLLTGTSAVLLSPLFFIGFLLGGFIGAIPWAVGVAASSAALMRLFPPDQKTPDLGQLH